MNWRSSRACDRASEGYYRAVCWLRGEQLCFVVACGEATTVTNSYRHTSVTVTKVVNQTLTIIFMVCLKSTVGNRSVTCFYNVIILGNAEMLRKGRMKVSQLLLYCFIVSVSIATAI